jgi:hypothetical protein
MTISRSRNLFSFLFIFVSLANVSFAEEGDSDPNAINVRTWEDYKTSRPAEIQDNCELDEMRAYSLVGDSQSLGEPNELCPAVTDNCCGKIDQENIKNLWRRDSKRIEQYTTYTLKVFRYLLGNGENFYDIAKRIALNYKSKNPERMEVIERADNRGNGANNNGGAGGLNSNIPGDEEDGYNMTMSKYCFDAAEVVLKANYFEKETIEPFYQLLSHKAEYLHNVRASFYCSLCSVTGQGAFRTWRVISSLNNIEFSPEFCTEVVAQTYSATNMVYKSYNKLVKNILKMLTCIQVPADRQTGNSNVNGGNQQIASANDSYGSTDPPYQYSEALANLIDNPFGMGSWSGIDFCQWAEGSSMFKFTKCEKYCENFQIAKAGPVMEYDAPRMRDIFDFVEQYQEIFPRGWTTNVFRDDVLTLKKEIKELYFKLPYDGIFFISKDANIDFSTYGTDFTLLSSFNPMALAEGHQLDFNYQSESIVKMFMMMMFALIFVNKL